MKQSIPSEGIILSENELSETRGGRPAGTGPHAPEGPTGRPLPKPRPGETPPIVIIERPLA